MNDLSDFDDAMTVDDFFRCNRVAKNNRKYIIKQCHQRDEDGNAISDFFAVGFSNGETTDDGRPVYEWFVPSRVLERENDFSSKDSFRAFLKKHKEDLLLIEPPEGRNFGIFFLAAKEDEYVQPDIYEEGTLYTHKINKLRSHSFSDIRNISVWFLRDYDDEEKDELKKKIGDGTSILTTYEQLHAYMYSFGLMHEAKLRQAFIEIHEDFFDNSEIEVIDYACGQGIASICFANFIEEYEYDTIIRKITLIEPSTIALSRAALLCHKVCPNALIETIGSDFDNLENYQISETGLKRVHLLSNILDMACYDINHLAEVLNRNKNKGDIFVCVDPWYHDNSKDGRQRRLMRLVKGREIYHDAFNSHQLVPDRTWTAYITIFTI